MSWKFALKERCLLLKGKDERHSSRLYILGGNNSSEVRVGLGGQINMPPYPSLGYILNEIGPDRIGNARGAHHYQDWKKWDVIAAEPNISHNHDQSQKRSRESL